MTIHTVTADELEAIAFDSGAPIHLGHHEADCQVGERLYVARIEAVQP